MSTRCRTSWPTHPGWWGSIPSPGWSITWNGRPSDHALRLLAPGVRRLAAERPRRKVGGELGVRAPTGAAERADRLRPDPDRRAEPERYQRTERTLARCLEHGGGPGGGDRATRADGGGPAHLPPARAAREAGREHRQHQRRPGHAERGVLLVVGRSQAVRRRLRPARRTLRAHGGVARGRDGHVVGAALQLRGQVLSGGGRDPRAQAAGAPSADAVRGRRVRDREGSHRARVRRLSHARRSAGADRRQGRGHAGAARAPGGGPRAARVRSRRVRRIRGIGGGRSARGGAHHRRAPERRRLRQLSGLARQHPARAAGEPRGLLRVEPGPACGTRGHGAADRRAHPRVRAGGGGSPAVAIQPAVRGDGAVRGRGDAARRDGSGRAAQLTNPPLQTAPQAADASGWWATVRQALRGSHHDYTAGPLGRAIILLAIPMVMEMLMESLLTLIYTAAMGLSIGVTAMVARRIGESNTEGAAEAAVQGIALGLLVAAGIGMVGVSLAPRLLAVMGATPAVQALGSAYARVMLGGNVVILLLFLINAIFRGAGDAAIAMRVLWLANGINLALGPCLIFGVGPFPRLGVTGAAIATTLGRGTGVLYQLYRLWRGDARVSIRRSLLTLKPAVMRTMLRLSGTGTIQVLIGR